MGSNETAHGDYASAVSGRPSGPNYLLFSDADRDSSPIGLGSGSRRHRMRRFLGLPTDRVVGGLVLTPNLAEDLLIFICRWKRAHAV